VVTCRCVLGKTRRQLCTANDQPKSPVKVTGIVKSKEESDRCASILEAQAAYIRCRPELLFTHLYKWVAMHKTGVVAIADSRELLLDALEKSGNSKPDGPYFTTLIGSENYGSVLYLTGILRPLFATWFKQVGDEPLTDSSDLLPPLPGEGSFTTKPWPAVARFSPNVGRPYLSLGVQASADGAILPATFLVDTGSTLSYLDRAIIDKLKLKHTSLIESLRGGLFEGYACWNEGRRIIVCESQTQPRLCIKTLGRDGSIITEGVLNILGVNFLAFSGLMTNWKEKVQIYI